MLTPETPTHPLRTLQCTNCGVFKPERETRRTASGLLCDTCRRALDAGAGAEVPGDTATQAARPAAATDVRAATCIIVGLFALSVGLFLLFNPGVPVQDPAGVLRDATPEVVNLQRLTIGQTFSIIGAIFLAAGIRPRS